MLIILINHFCREWGGLCYPKPKTTVCHKRLKISFSFGSLHDIYVIFKSVLREASICGWEGICLFLATAEVTL